MPVVDVTVDAGAGKMREKNENVLKGRCEIRRFTGRGA
jgi:hypothetical protein